MQRWTKSQDPITFIGRKVRATKTIHQSPTSSDPNVPRGAVGWIEDYVDDLFWVDFDGKYGVVASDWDEITLV